MRLEYAMEWTEFVTKWAKKDLYIESLQLGDRLTDAEIETILASFPDTEQFRQQKEVAAALHISGSTVKSRFTKIYEKCGLSNNNSSQGEAEAENNSSELKQELRKRSIAAFNQLSLEKPESTPTTLDTPTPTPQLDWFHISHQLLTQQKHLTTNPLQLGANRNLDDIHVPLGLMERRERPKVKQEPSPEMGSQLLQPTELTETKRLEHEEFLAEVVGKRAVNSKHIAIIGEPGAGKTTLLTKIGEWLLTPASQSEPAVVVWVSLAAVGSRRLEEYLKQEWLRQVWDGEDLTTPWESFKQIRQQGQVWLLLDGLDEMSGDAVWAIQRDLSEKWAEKLRVVVTCRLNQWDGASHSLVNSFEVYRTLDYEYRTATGEDRVLEFLTKWFENPDTTQQIRIALDDPGKERIKDLVKNPLRLTLFCASWAENQALPDTQAELYRRFVNYLYRWKAHEFQAEVSLRLQLDPALGKLATAGLNRQPNRDGAVRRFRFTEPEIAKLWQDLPSTLLPAAKKLGWLNVVGTEAGENIYAFFHPTFQEYFAACSIEDWDYFLPRAHVNSPVPCMGETEPTYRVFEKEWQQPILLWIGRGDVGDELKEEFIEKLTNFQAQGLLKQRVLLSSFDRWMLPPYRFRAYCMAAICVGEFKSSRQARGIVEQIVAWSFSYPNSKDFSYSNSKGKSLHNFSKKMRIFFEKIRIENLATLASETIPLTHRRYAISELIILLENPNFLDYDLNYRVAKILGRIDAGNKKAIHTLLALLETHDLDNGQRHRTAIALGEIAVGNKDTIDTLLTLLGNNDLDYWQHYYLLIALREIAIGNEKAIDRLQTLLDTHDLDNWLPYYLSIALSRISGKEIDRLQTFLDIYNLDLDTHGLTSQMVLIELQNFEQVVQAIDELKQGKSAILDMTLMREEEAQRSVDFVAGGTYAIDGHYERIGDNIFVFTPSNNEKAIDGLQTPLDTHNSISQILLTEPRSFEEMPQVIDELKQGKSAILDMTLMNVEEAQRSVDFVAGGTYAIDGHYERIGDDIFLFTPSEIFVFTPSKSEKAIYSLDTHNSILLAEPRNFEEMPQVTDELKQGKSAILNMALMSEEEVQRSLDFIHGFTCTIDGRSERIGNYNFLFTPSHVQVVYPPFTKASYHSIPNIPFSLSHIPSQLNRPHTILLDITPLSAHTPTEIPQTLTNLIYSQLAIQPIPLVTTIAQLQTHLLNLNYQPHLVIILHHPTDLPPTLIPEIAKLQFSRQIQVLWLSNSGTIPDAISPDSSDLVAAIESAISRFEE